MTQIENIAGFLDKALALGAKVETTVPFSKGPFKVWASADNGGCGSDGCRCSPGLWVSASDGETLATAHFGSDYERGGEGTFTRRDYARWLKLLKAAGVK